MLYQCIAELTFEDVNALQAGLGSEEGQAAVNDVPNFATGGVTIFFAEITEVGPTSRPSGAALEVRKRRRGPSAASTSRSPLSRRAACVA